MARFFFFWLAGVSVTVAFCIQTLGQLPDGKLHIFFLDIGQGDSVLLVTPGGNRILIDTGPPGRIAEPLRKAVGYASDRIDLVVLTQYDQDHAGGTLALLDQFDVAQAMVIGVQQGTSMQQAVMKKLNDRNVPIWIGYSATDFWLDRDVMMDIIWPNVSLAGKYVPKVNEYSLVSRILLRGRPVLLDTADIGFETEKKLLASGANLRANILKVGHHGSRFSTSDDFLRAVRPLYSGISAGAKNRYGHPTSETLARLLDTGTQIFRTDMMGTIEMVVNPESGRVETIHTSTFSMSAPSERSFSSRRS